MIMSRFLHLLQCHANIKPAIVFGLGAFLPHRATLTFLAFINAPTGFISIFTDPFFGILIP